MFDSLIFDMDGTIWDTADAVCKAWNEVFAAHGIHKEVTTEEMYSYMGLPMDEIGKRIFTEEKYPEYKHVFDECMEYEKEYISRKGGILYEGLVDTLEKISASIPLYIVSNCQDGYIESFFSAHKTQKYFKDYECYGRSGLLKSDNIQLVVNRNGLKNPAYVGDTEWDEEAAKKAGVPFIFAEYGFGQAKNPDYRIQKFSDLCELLSHKM